MRIHLVMLHSVKQRKWSSQEPVNSKEEEPQLWVQ